MNILFICGSLEPGRDGVGDYTRRLAAALINMGHIAGVVSLNDSKSDITPVNNKEYQEQDGAKVPVLRLNKHLPWKQKEVAVQQMMTEYKPDWISLQYVPYSFNSKGCPVMLGYRLSRLTKSAKWHIMIHEPFLGKTNSFKEKFIQYLQILSVKQLFSQLKPLSVHTSLSHYANMVKQSTGKEIKLLGLFGNVPMEADYKKESGNGKQTGIYKAVFFGSAPKKEDWSSIADKLKIFIEDNKVKVELYIAGRLGPLGDGFCNFLEEKLYTKDTVSLFHVLGGVELDDLSKLFSNCDFGISRVPARLLGKSGTAISMLEHGLPLWIAVHEGKDDDRFLHFGKNLCFFNLSDLEKAKDYKPEFGSRLNIIGKHFLQDLQDSTSRN